MSPLGSAAYVYCLIFYLHSVDSFDSCSLKTQVISGSSNIRMYLVKKKPSTK